MSFTFDYISRNDSTYITTMSGIQMYVTVDDTIMHWNATAVEDQGEEAHSNPIRTVYADQEDNDLPFLRDPQPSFATTSKPSRSKPWFDNMSTGWAMPYRWPETIMSDFQLVFTDGEVDNLTQTLKRIRLRRWPFTVNDHNRGMTVVVPDGSVKTRIEEDTYGYGTAGMAICIGRGAFFLPPFPIGDSTFAHPAMDRIAMEPDLFGLLSRRAQHRTGIGPDDFRLTPARPLAGEFTLPYTADGSGNFWRVGEEVELWSQCPVLPPGSPFTSSRYGFQPFWGLPPSVAVGTFLQYQKPAGEPAPVCVLEIYLQQQLYDGTETETLVHSESMSTYPIRFLGPDSYGIGGYFTTTNVGTMAAGCTSFRYRAQIVVDGTTGPTEDSPNKPNTSDYAVHHKIPPSVPWGGCSGQGLHEAGPIPGLLFKRYPAP